MNNKYIVCTLLLSLAFSCSRTFQSRSPDRFPVYTGEQEIEQIKQAIQYFDDGKYERSEQIYLGILQKNPHSIKALYELSYQYFILDEYTNSIQIAQEGILYKSELLRHFYYLLIENYTALGQFEEALQVRKQLSEIFSDDQDLQYELGLSFLKQNDLNEADKYLTRAFMLNPDNPLIHIATAELYNRKKQRLQTLLSLSYLLMIETDSSRISVIQSQLEHQLKSDDTFLLDFRNDNPATRLELVLIRFLDDKSDTAGGIPQITDRANLFESLFAAITEDDLTGQQDQKLYYYLKMYHDLHMNDMTKTFCYYIHRNSGLEGGRIWLEMNQQQVNKLLMWRYRET